MLFLHNISLILQTSLEGKKKVSGSAMLKINSIADAWLICRNGKIEQFGKMANAPDINKNEYECIDCSGRLVMPAFVDSHTHLVFPAYRQSEFLDKIKGLSYEEIAKRGGGILNSAKKMADTSEETLFEEASQRLQKIIAHGTGAIEIKSGYGLSTETELKMLRVIKRLKQTFDIPIRSTFLGAHAFPSQYKKNQEAYVKLIIEEMLPQIAKEDLADFMDVFCDRGFFSAEQTEQLLKAGLRYNLPPKIHANELDYSGGIQAGVKYNALSVDHIECTGPDEIQALKNSETMPTVLPGTAFFLNLDYPPARKIIDAGLPLAMASDFNPGSCPSYNMWFTMALGSIKLKLMPEECLNAVTQNAAYALGVENELGSIDKGKRANLIITNKVDDLNFLPYSFGENHTWKMLVNGKVYRK